MATHVPIIKDPLGEHLVPSAWRKALETAVDAIAAGDFGAVSKIDGFVPIAMEDVAAIKEIVADYGSGLVCLPQSSWDTSVCSWQGSYWQLLVDLSTEDESPSDLVMFVRATEISDYYGFEITSVHVP